MRLEPLSDVDRTHLHDTETWAQDIAANLPPLTPTEAAALGKLAAALDARRAHLKEPG